LVLGVLELFLQVLLVLDYLQVLGVLGVLELFLQVLLVLVLREILVGL
tara:strand:- start:495 stop:638 length:144 start_codon:yes stop_codon:yes gene_type:complete